MSAGAVKRDVIIAGGGMIGSCAALAIASLGLKVAVVEPVSRKSREQPSFDDRSTALSRSSQRLFEALGLWADIAAASTPIQQVHVSDQGRFGFAHIDAGQQGVEALGYVVINRVLGEVLHAAISAVPGIELLTPARVTGLEAQSKKVVARIEDGGGTQEVTSRLLVAADGANSTVRDMLGIGAVYKNYCQQAVIGNVHTEKPTANRAFERFTESGPLAMLPMDEHRAAFIWTQDDAAAERVVTLDDQVFLDELQVAFGYRLGALRKVGERKSYPLSLSKALRLTASRSVLIGNAAHGLHPVAAQGFNLGLRDVAALCDCVADALEDGQDSERIGSPDVLESYAAWRRADQRKLVRFTDGLVGLFRSRRGPQALARNAGMLAFDLVPGIRNEFARHTMGLAGRLPRLSRGVPLR